MYEVDDDADWFRDGYGTIGSDPHEDDQTFNCCQCHKDRPLDAMDGHDFDCHDQAFAWCRFCVNGTEECQGCGEDAPTSELEKGNTDYGADWCLKCQAAHDTEEERKAGMF